MPRLVLPVAALSVGVGLAIGAVTIAQDQTGPDGTLAATPAATRCAEPAPAGGTPRPAESGTPVPDDHCGTPTAGTPVTVDDVATDALINVEIRFVDVAFVPKEVTIPANTDVTITFVNDGAATHDFKIASPGVFSGYLGPGGTTEVVVNLPPGTYPFACTIPGHAASGMVGVLIVR